jgi:hypothetical protein
MIETKQDAHALLSASGSERWIGCPASVAMEFGVQDETNEYAAEGIKAHELAREQLDWLVKFQNDLTLIDSPLDLCNNDSLRSYVQEYINYLMALNVQPCMLWFEQKVDFSNAVINGYGTADAVIYNESTEHLHIVDFKYGFNKVEAKDNTQMLLYVIGAVNFVNRTISYNGNFKVKTITLHIVQPRIGNFDTWSLTIEELQDWIKYFQVQSVKALTLSDQYNPSATNCKYCKEKKRCPALNKFVDNMALELKQEMDTGKLFASTEVSKVEMSNDFIKKVLDNSSLIKQYLKLVDDTAKERLTNGQEIEGYKLVRAASRRKISHHDELRLQHNYGDKVFRKTLLSLAELEAVVGKKNLDFYTHKSEGGVVVV